MGLVEPPAVIRDSRESESHLLLDGHLRIEVLRDLGATEVECLISTDDEAFTYNKRISRLSPVQEQRMIAKAIERNVPRDKIARALDINVRSLTRKVQLLDGICEEAIGLLKDKICPMAVFDVLRKMSPMRQIETAELLINANNFSISYASAILAGTPQAQLVDAQTPKRGDRSYGARTCTPSGSHHVNPGLLWIGSPASYGREGISNEADWQRAGRKVSGAISTGISRRISKNCRDDINAAERGRLVSVGDPDPKSAGTAGEAAPWGGSIAVMGMAATPLGAHQAMRAFAGRTN